MTAPLIPVGGIGLATLAWNGLRQFQPGQFLRELWGGADPDMAASEFEPSDTSIATETLDLSQSVLSLAKELRFRFSAAGVDLSQPLVLKDDGNGGVIIDGDHPDRATVEYLLAASPNLRAEFQSVLRAATEKHDKLAPWLGQCLGEFRLELDEYTSAVRFE